jgi:hypothetical protein
MSADEIHVGDKGTRFAITVYDGTTAVDISASTARTLEFRKPDGTIFTATAALTTGGTDGGMYYDVPTTTTLDQSGRWKMQGVVSFSGSVFHTDVYPFLVEPNLT